MRQGQPVFRNVFMQANVPFSIKPVPGHKYVMGIDWGYAQDRAGIILIDSDTSQVVAVESFLAFSWAHRRDRIKYVERQWKPAVALADSIGLGGVNVEALQAEGFPIRGIHCPPSVRMAMADALSGAIVNRELALLPIPSLLEQLIQCEHIVIKQGLGVEVPSIANPVEIGDELLNALLLCWWAKVKVLRLGVQFA